MAFHDATSLKLTMGNGGALRADLQPTWPGHNDFYKSEDGGVFVMVRMFRRLLRGGSRPRVVGGWTV